MHEQYLLQALELAEQRRGFCAPNPAVGAVLVSNNNIISRGTHWANGHPHAEVEALKTLTEIPKDAVLYISLEPCCAHPNKKTPPCTDLILQSGVKKVVFGFKDPNPKVAGSGQKFLQAAGIECQHFPVSEIDNFYQSYAHWVKSKLPFVTAKLALSLDNKIAGPDGQRMQITGEPTQHFTHQQRLRSDAILTTARTILKDNPLLNIRLDQSKISKPIYILDRELNTTDNFNIFNTAESVTLFHDINIKPKAIANARCVGITTKNKQLNLKEILEFIGHTDGKHDLWVEAGSTCFTAFAEQNLLQSAFIYLAPKILGPEAQDAFINFTVPEIKSWRVCGEDIIYKLNWL